MSNQKMTIAAICAVLLIAILYLSLGGGIEYPDTDTSEVDRDELIAITEKLLADSESWPVELQDGGVEVSTSLDPYPVRTVRYSIEGDGDIEKAIEILRDENYSGETRRHKNDKYEDTMWEEEAEGFPSAWVRRSVHIAPPPGGNRDAVVIYFEDQPDPRTYRTVFQSVETIEGESFPEVEDAVRFKVLPSIYKVEETAPGKIRIRKVEAVDPRGAMSPLMNNHVISLVFFRSYMFEQAKNMRDVLAAAAAGS